jgi:hypothetical protein
LALVLSRKTEDLCLLNGAARRFIGGGHDEIRERPPLDFRGALQASENLFGQARLQPGCGLGLPFHNIHTIRQIAVQGNLVASPLLGKGASLKWNFDLCVAAR